MDEIVRFLVEHPPWRDLPRDQVRELAGRIEIEYFPRGARLPVMGGATSPGLVVVRSGSVEVLRPGCPCHEFVDRLGEGETLGGDAVAGGCTSDLTALAREDTLAYLVPRDALARVLDAPSVRRFLSADPGERLRDALEGGTSSPGGDLLAMAVGDLVTRPPLACPPEMTVAEAARRMQEARVGSLLVRGDPPGIVTDRDLRNRVLAVGGDPNGPVGAIQSAPLVTLPADALLLEALALMVERGVHHLPVTRDQQVVGVVTHTDVLRRQSRSPLLLSKVLERARTSTEAAAWVGLVGAAIAGLVQEGVRPSAVGRVAALAGDALVRRTLESVALRLGPAPSRWAWLATAAEGRCEAAWPPSRTGFLLWEDGATPATVGWCASLASQTVRELEAAGLRPPRDVPSAAVPAGLGPASATLVAAVMDGDLGLLRALLDGRPVAGTLDAAPFLGSLAEAAGRRGPLDRLAGALPPGLPIGFFEGAVLLRDGRLEDRLDLDRCCLGALVDLARLLAVRGGVRLTSTPGRLRAAGERGLLPGALARDLAATFEILAGQRSRLASATGECDCTAVDPDLLSPPDRRVLKDAFAVLRAGLEASAGTAPAGRAPWTA